MSKRNALRALALPTIRSITMPPVFAAAQGDQPIMADLLVKVGEISAATTIFKDKFGKRLDGVESSLKEIDAYLAEQNSKAATARAFGGTSRFTLDDDERTAFAKFGRTGFNAAMTTDNNPDGGYLVPQTVEQNIARLARDANTLRKLATTVTIEGNSYVKTVSLNGPNATWVSEKEARAQTDGMKLSQLEFFIHELEAMPALTQTIIDDARVDVAAELSSEIVTAFSEKENVAFVSGDGVKKPRGILDYDTVANGSWAWGGKLGFIKSGDASGFIAASTSASPADCLIDTVYGLKAGYRANAAWLMSSATASVVRKFKAADGTYVWRDSVIAGQPATLLGYPVVIEENMPSLSGGNFPIAFGDFKRGYLVVDRIGIRVLRDPYTAKPYVLFYTTKRVGGGVQDFAAIKLLKIAS